MKYLAVSALLILTLTFCSTREPGKVMEKDSENYKVAQKLASKASFFSPDSNIVVATTSDFEVTIADVVERMRANFGKQVEFLDRQPLPRLKQLTKEVAENVAMTRVTLKLAAENGITVADSAVEAVLADQYQRAGGEEKFTQFVENNGISMDMVRRDIRDQQAIKLYLDGLKENVSVSEEEIDAAYQEDKTASVRHILLSTDGKSEEEKKAQLDKITELLDRIRNGEDFSELAKKHSDDPGSKDKGGLYENFPRGQMVPAFDEAAFTVPVGQVSDVVETRFGYHILKVEGRKKEERPREQVKEELFQKKYEEYNKMLYDDLKIEYELTITELS